MDLNSGKHTSTTYNVSTGTTILKVMMNSVAEYARLREKI
jgi:hypothetical protein